MIKVENKLTVQEQTYKSWKVISVGSAILCVVFLGIFWFSADPFWTGIFRLISFILFAVTVFGWLKLLNGPLKVTLHSTGELLLVTYYKKDKKIQEEQFEQAQIKKIVQIPSSRNILESYLQDSSGTFKIDFTDTDRKLYLFQFSGRPLQFGRKSQQEIKDFLTQLGITV